MTSILIAIIQVNFKSKRRPMIMEEPEKAFPGGSKRKKNTRRARVIKIKKTNTTDNIHLGNLGILLKKVMLC